LTDALRLEYKGLSSGWISGTRDRQTRPHRRSEIIRLDCLSRTDLKATKTISTPVGMRKFGFEFGFSFRQSKSEI